MFFPVIQHYAEVFLNILLTVIFSVENCNPLEGSIIDGKKFNRNICDNMSDNSNAIFECPFCKL